MMRRLATLLPGLGPDRNPYYAGPPSDHFDGLRFFNPGGSPPRDFRDLLKWQRQRSRAQWPRSVALPQGTAQPPARVDGAGLRVTMVGHATLLIQTAGLNLLTDPVWSDRASPLAFAGPRRVTAPGIAFDDLPKIDAVLLTHNHYDHLDLATLGRLQRRDAPLVVTPLGNDRIIARALPAMRVVTGDWGEVTALGPLTVHVAPCHHWSARSLGDRSMALWAAFVIEGPAGTVLHVGDTGFDGGRPYRAWRDRHGAPRLAILPVGAYEPRWFMRAQHQDPDEAVEGFRLLGATSGIGHHWGTFQLTDEPREAPPVALAAALSRHGIPDHRFRALHPGESWQAD